MKNLQPNILLFDFLHNHGWSASEGRGETVNIAGHFYRNYLIARVGGADGRIRGTLLILSDKKH